MGNYWDRDPLVEGGALNAPYWAKDQIISQHAEPAKRAELSGPSRVLYGLTNDLLAAQQGASPIITGMDGKYRYKRLGPIKTYDFGEAIDTGGEPLRFDRKRHVNFIDPNTGDMTAYERAPDNDESKLTSFGRLLSLGALSTIPRGLGAAAKGASGMAGAVRDFTDAKVPPSVAGTLGGRTSGGLQAFLKDVPGAGSLVQRAAGRQIQSASDRALEIAKQYGTPADPFRTGGKVQQGVMRFSQGGDDASAGAPLMPSRATSFKAKADELYNDLGKVLPLETNVRMDDFLGALSTQGKRIDNEALAKVLQNPTLKKWADTITEEGGMLSFNDARMMRQEVGKLLKDPTLRGTLDSKSVKIIYGAATTDMQRAAMLADEIAAAGGGGGKALDTFRRADRFYEAGVKRIDDSLTDIFKAPSPEAAYQQILNAASGKGSKADLGKIYQLQRSLRDEEWGDVAATVISRLGRGPTGADEFSPAKFITDYKSMSPQAKSALFDQAGNGSHRKALDTLFRVSERLQKAEKLTNYSGTGRQAIYGATLGAGLYADPVFTITSLAGAAGAAKLMMSPEFTRWLAKGATLVEMSPPAAVKHLATIGAVAREAPHLAREIDLLSEKARR